MSLHQTSESDLLAMPGSIAAAFRQLNGQRAQVVAERTDAAHQRHDQRCEAHRAALMRGDLPLLEYRRAVAESVALRDDDIAAQPPIIDVELSHARVEARVLGVTPGLWAEELAREQAAQQAWAAANDGNDGETIAEREQGTVYA